MDEKEKIKSCCLEKEVAPCVSACPFHIDARTFISRMRRGGFNFAYRLYADSVGFPDIVSRLCGAPCEAGCPLKQTDGPIAMPTVCSLYMLKIPSRAAHLASTTKLLSMSLGGVCGAVSGAMVALGWKYGHSAAGELNKKEQVRRKAAEFQQKFAARRGSIVCRELLGYDFSKPGQREAAQQSGATSSVCPGVVLDALAALDEVMPLIRFRTGDRGRLLSGRCRCGSCLQRLDKVRGRLENEIMLPDGRSVSIHMSCWIT